MYIYRESTERGKELVTLADLSCSLKDLALCVRDI